MAFCDPSYAYEDETRKPGLPEVMRRVLRVKHYSLRTEEAYTQWVRRFVAFHGRQHPREMGGPEVAAFLSHLVNDGGGGLDAGPGASCTTLSLPGSAGNRPAVAGRSGLGIVDGQGSGYPYAGRGGRDVRPTPGHLALRDERCNPSTLQSLQMIRGGRFGGCQRLRVGLSASFGELSVTDRRQKDDDGGAKDAGLVSEDDDRKGHRR